MAHTFRAVERDQQFLMPPSVREWLPQGHLAWFVLDVVDRIDVSAVEGGYSSDGRGAPAYDPSMMVALLLYAYCLGERSSRVIERRCVEDVAFRVLAANQQPDHVTIARFRQRHQQALAGVFVEVLRLCAAAGLVRLGLVAIDSTKLAAVASPRATRTYADIRAEVEAMLAEAAAVDDAEDAALGDARGDELPAELADPRSRLARLVECQRQIEQQVADRQREVQRRIDAREQRRQRREERIGRKLKPAPSEPDSDARANPSDPDSRMLKQPGGFVQGYSAHAVVTEDQVIVGCALTNEQNDAPHLRPIVDDTAATLQQAGVEDGIEVAVADAGYWSQDNFRVDHPDAPEMFVVTRSGYPGRPSPAKQRMEQQLASDRGREAMARRKQIVEPVFGQIKEVRGFRRFSRRGLDACASEWALTCTTHNLLKLWRHTSD